MTSFTPFRPRRTSSLRKPDQKVSASPSRACWPCLLRRSDRWPPGHRWTDVQADDLAPPVGVGCHGDYRRDGDPGVPEAASRLGVGRSCRPREPSGRWRRAAGAPMQPAAWGGQRYGQSPSSCRLRNAPTMKGQQAFHPISARDAVRRPRRRVDLLAQLGDLALADPG